jgi:hypothetical protein
MAETIQIELNYCIFKIFRPFSKPANNEILILISSVLKSALTLWNDGIKWIQLSVYRVQSQTLHNLVSYFSLQQKEKYLHEFSFAISESSGVHYVET